MGIGGVEGEREGVYIIEGLRPKSSKEGEGDCSGDRQSFEDPIFGFTELEVAGSGLRCVAVCKLD